MTLVHEEPDLDFFLKNQGVKNEQGKNFSGG